ncbi:MAG TPA: ABC-2 family transporter protein [Verrucomicrobiae bacterium]|nr:ABC-2 family transporter protein [Verrucomicrobiae bacterium]
MSSKSSQPAASQNSFRRYLGLYGALWRNSVMREMGFKSSFLLWIVVEGMWFALHLCFVGVIYMHTDHIGDWSKWQVVMLFGASQLIQQLFQSIFLTNCTQLSELVRTGKLDFMLLMPASTRFLVSMRQVDLGGFVNAASGLGVMAYAAWQMHLVPDWWRVLGFAACVVAGVLLHYSLMFMLCSISFWTVRAGGIVWSYYSLFSIARLPDAAFRGVFKTVFTFAIPMLLVSNVPVKLLIDKLGSPREVALLVLFCAICYLLSDAVWRKSLRHYTSASS